MNSSNKDHSKRPKVEIRRLTLIGFIAFSLWVISVFPKLKTSSDEMHDISNEIPPISEWSQVVITRPGWRPVTLSKSVGDLAQGAPLNLWRVEGRYPLDPHLSAPFSSDAHHPLRIIERRSLSAPDDASYKHTLKTLSLSEVALSLKIINLEGVSLDTLRVGVEHLGRSTWVWSERTPREIWRVDRRLRAIFDHPPHTWRDRRVITRKRGEIFEVSLYRGEVTPTDASPPMWTLSSTQGEPASSPSPSAPNWIATGSRLAPELSLEALSTIPIDQQSIKALIYSLKTLKVDRFLSEETRKGWKGSHTFSWRTHPLDKEGEPVRHWVSLKPHPEGGAELKWSEGVGYIPNHINHFLRPSLSSYIERTLSCVPPTKINAVTWRPTRTASVDARHQVLSWRAYRVPAGWSLQIGDLTHSIPPPSHSDEQLSPASLERWFNALSRDGAGANVGPNAPRSILGALTIETLDLSLCQEIQSPCLFTLRFYEGPHRLVHVERSWDPITLTLSKDHFKRLTEWP